MTVEEAALLLSRAGFVDGRAPSIERATIWQEIMGDLSYEDGVAALVAYQRDSSRPVQPADLLAWDRRLKQDAADAERRELARSFIPEPKRGPLSTEQKAALNAVYRQGLREARAAKGDPRPLSLSDRMWLDAPTGDSIAHPGEQGEPISPEGGNLTA